MEYSGDIENYNDKSFFKLWRNIVINRIIFQFYRLYNKNKIVVFNNIKSLRLYKHREYITKIILKSSNGNLKIGDLPICGVLKKLDFTHYSIPIHSDIIPNGIEKIKFYNRGNYTGDGSGTDQIVLSEFPVSVKSAKNVQLKKPYSNNTIPENIKSISFSNIDPLEFYSIKLPDHIVKLDLLCLIENLKKLNRVPSNYLPNNLTVLKLPFDSRYLHSIPMIPSTIKKLYLYIRSNCFIKDLIPYGIEELNIFGFNDGGIRLLTDSLPCSLTKLSIQFGNQDFGMDNIIHPHSIPKSVLDLKIKFTRYPDSFDWIFPYGITNLDISSIQYSKPPQSYELPSSIKYLKIDNVIVKQQ